MILIDTSAWVEFLRGTGSPVDDRLEELVRRGRPMATTDVVLMELLAGARDDAHRERLKGLLARCEFLPTGGPGDYEAAADLYRVCRRSGETIRSLTDCLVAAVAMRSGTPVLHADTDFEAIARHTSLKLA